MSGTSNRTTTPRGRTADFVRDVMKASGQSFVRAWLDELNCDFTSETIFTTGVGREKLLSEHYGLAAKHRVRISHCENVTKRFYDEMDRRAGKKVVPHVPRVRPSYLAGDRQRRFKEAMQKRLRERLWQVIFDVSQIKYDGDDFILVRAPIWKIVLERDGADLLDDYGLAVSFAPQEFLHEPGPQGELGEDVGPEERGKLARALRHLAISMRKKPARGISPVAERLAAARQRTHKEEDGGADA